MFKTMYLGIIIFGWMRYFWTLAQIRSNNNENGF